MAYPRIVYNTNNIYVDFDRGIRNLRLPLDENIKTIMASSGVKEFLHFYQIQSVEFLIQNYTTQFEKLLRAWYNYCRLGNSLKLIIDPDILFFLDFENGIYSNDNLQGTFSYQSAGEYYFEDDRELLIKNNGLPRYPNGKFGKGMLFENIYDNLQPNFNTFSAWTQLNLGVTTDTSLVEDPLGTNTADILIPTGAGGVNCSITYDTGVALSAGEDITTAIYLKSPSANITPVTINIYGYIASWNLIGWELTNIVTTEWQRFYATIESSGSNFTDIRIEIIWSNSVSNVLYAFYSQLQKLLYPVSVQKLTNGMGSSDVCYWDVSGLVDQRLIQFSIGFWAKLPYNHDKHAQDSVLMYITRSGTSNVHSLVIVESGGNIRCRVSGTDNASIETSVSASGYIVEDTWCYIVLTADTTISNGIKLYINSTLVLTSTNDPFAVCEGDRLYIGSYHSGVQNCDGIIDDFIIEAKVLTATEISRRYTLNRSLGIERNIFDSVFLKEFNFNSSLRNGVPRKTVQLSFEEELT